MDQFLSTRKHKIIVRQRSGSRRFSNTFFTLLFTFSFLFSSFPQTALAAQIPPQILTYQGRLTDSGGNLLGGSGTSYTFKFSFWNSSTAGSRVWPVNAPTATSTLVKQGVFTMNIGDTAGNYPDPLNLDFSNYASLYLQVEVFNGTSYEALLPRQQLTSAAFAQLAGAVVGTTTPSVFGTTTPVTNSFVTIAATSTNSIPLSIIGVLNQVANLFQIQNSAGTNIFSVSATGGVTAVAATTTSSFATTASSTNLFTSNLSIGSLSGILKAVGGAVTTALVNLASDVTGILTVGNGGTGVASVVTNAILLGNGTGAIATTSAGINGQVLKLSGGVPTWGTDLTGSGGGAGFFSTTTDDLAIYPTNPAYVVLLGNNATTTTGNVLEVLGNSLFRGALTAYNTIAAPIFSATSTSATSTFSGGLSTANLAVTGNTGLLKASTGGYVVNATAGIDYENPLTFTFPLSRSANAITFGGLSTSTAAVVGNIPYFSGANTFANVATTSFTPSAEFTIGGTLGALVGGANSTLTLATNGVALTKLAQVAANTILGNNTGATGNVIAVATSTFFGTPTAGTILAFLNGVNTYVATSTLNIGGNASTATQLQTSRSINGTAFNGTSDITITAASSTLLANNNTFSGTNTFTVAPVLASFTGLVGANGGVTYAISTSSPLNTSITGNAATVTTNANLTGVVTSSGNTTSYGSQAAGVLGNAATGNTAPMATSTLYGAVQNGMVLAGLNGSLQYVATTTYSSGLSYVSGNVTNTGVLSIGPTAQTITGAVTIATSSTPFNGLTASTTITGSGQNLTFTNTLAGILGVAGGGTGQSSLSSSALLYGAGTGAVQSVGTTTLTGNNGLTLSAGNGYFVGGSNATIGLAAIAANSVLANGTGASAVPSAVATSTFFGTPTAGTILAFLNGANTYVSTTTLSIGGNASTVTTNANLSGVVTSSGNTTSYGSQAPGVLGNAITGNTAPMATSTLYGAVQNGRVLAGLNGTLQYVATTTASCASGITCSYAAGVDSFTLASMAAGVLGTPVAGIPSSQATSTLYGSSVGGMVLGWDNNTGGVAWIATSTAAGGVTAVTGTWPIISSGGSTPAISIAFGTTTSNLWSGTQTFSTATTTNLIVSSAGGTGTRCAQFGADGTISATAGACGVAGAGIQNLGPLGQLQSGTTQTLATSTSAFNGLTVGLTITGSTDTQTFTPTLSGTLTVAGGGTGLSSLTGNRLIYTDSAGTAFAQVATSSLSIGGTAANVTGTVAVTNGGTGSTTAPISQLLYGGATAYQSVATTTLATNNGISISANAGALVGGSAATIGLSAINAGVLGAQANATVPTSQATSTLYGTGTGGQVLMWSNTTNGLVLAATSSSAGGVTAVTGTWPIISSGGTTPNITFGGLSTSTAAVVGNLSYFSGANTFANVATSTISAGNGLTNTSGTFGYQVGGTNVSIGLAAINANSVLANVTGSAGVPTALATSSLGVALSDTTGILALNRGGTGLSSFTGGSLLYSNAAGTALLFAATSTLNIGGTAANVTGTVAVANGGTGTTTAPVSQLLYGGTGGVYQSVATTSATINNGLTGTLTTLGGTQTIGLAAIAANSVLANGTGASAVPSAVATSTFFGTPTAGTILAFLNGANTYVATTTLNIGGNAGTATALQTARTINGTSFDGTANITITAASSTLLANSNTFSGTNTFTTAPTFSTALSVTSGGTGATALSANQIPYVNSAGTALVTVATTTLTGNNGISISANAGALVGGSAATIGLSAINAGVLGAQANATVPTSQATSTLYGTGTGGQVLMWSNTTNGLVLAATSSSAGGVTAVTGTWPIISSGGSTPNITFGGLSTSTAAVVGNLSYFSGVNTFANVATTTFTPSAEFTTTGTIGALVGGANSTLTLATNGVALSKLAQVAANSILGNNTGATGNVVAFATSTLGIAFSDTSGTVLIARGGTGLTTVGDGQLIFGPSGGTALTTLATSTGGFLTNAYTTGRPSWVATSSLNVAISDTSGTLTVLRGGTGVTSFTGSQILYTNAAGTAIISAATSTLNIGGNAATVTTNANLTGVVTSSGNTTSYGSQAPGVLGSAATGNTAPMATSTLYGAVQNGQILAGVNGTLAYVATTTYSSGLSYASGNVTNTGVLSIGPASQTITGAVAIATSSTPFNGLTASTTITGSGQTLTFTNTLAGILGVGGGGTGQTSFTSNQLHYGNFSQVATTTFTPSAEFTTTGTIGALVGGANSTLTIATNGVALTKLAQVAANSILGNNTGATGNVVAFATSTLGIALSDTSGTLTVLRGGTGQTSFTGSQILYTNAAGTAIISAATSTLNIGGNAATVTTNANMSGAVTSSGSNVTAFGAAAANSVLANNTAGSAVPTFVATSTFFGTPTAGTILAFLNGQNTYVSTTTLNIGGTASNVTGTVAVANGGTGLGSFTGGSLLYSNAAGTALLFAATSTLNIGGNASTVTTNANLSGVVTSSGNTTSYGSQAPGVLGNAITGNTAPMATSTLYGAVQNGRVLAGLNGSLQYVATTTYSSGLSYVSGNVTNTGVLSIGPTAQTITGAVTIATSSTPFNGLTASTTITGSGQNLTFTNTLAGILGVAGGGTGQTSLSSSQLIYGAGTGAVQSVATSTISAGNGLTNTSGTFGYQVGGTNVSIGLAAIAANSVLANNTAGSAVPTFVATSTFFGTPTAGTILAFLNGQNTYVSTTTLNIGGTAANVTGTVAIANGGTGLSSLSGNQILYTNAAGTALVQTSTSTLSIGGNASTVTTNANLTGVVTSSGNTTSYGSQAPGVLGNAITGNTAPMATSTLYGAVQNGRVLAGLNGTLQFVATTTYSSGLSYASGNVTNTGVLSIGPTAQTITGAVTIATSSTPFNGLTASTTITGSGQNLTFTNTLAGILGVGGGGTGQSSFTSNQLHYGNFSQVATTTFTPSAEFTTTGTLGALVGGANSTLTIATNGVALTKLAQVAANTILGNNTGATGNVVAFATSTLGIALVDTSGTLTVLRGGTGVISFTGSQILYTNAAGTAIISTATSTLNIGGNAATVTTNANLSGAVTSSGSNVTAFGSQNAGVLGSAVTGIPSMQATSTLYGTGTGGQVLQWSNATGGLVLAATSSSAGGYSTVFDDSNGTLTQRTTLGFLGTGIDCVDNSGSGRTDCTVNAGAAAAGGSATHVQFNTGGSLDGNSGLVYISATTRLGVGTSSPLATLSASTTSAIATAIFDQRGTGGLLSLQQAGVDKFTVANSGGLTINAATSDIVKTNTGGISAQDFGATGSTLATTTSTRNYVTINDGTISGDGSIAATSTVTAAALGAGGQVVIRADGKYVIIHGGGSATASVWNGFSSGVMPTITVATGGTVGAGAIALKRPDGLYTVIHGGGANLSTNFDPYGITTVAAGPIPGGVCTTGTNAFLRQDGKYVILCGGTTAWTVYDPSTASTVLAGTAIGSNWGVGAHAVQRDDGTFLVYQGGGTNTFIYNPFGGTTATGNMNSGTMTAGPAAPAAIAAGAFSMRRTDGMFLTLPGAVTTSFVYNPVSTTTPNGTGAFSASLALGPSSALADGAQTMWRQDGESTLITANTTVVNVIDSGAGMPGTSGAANPTFTNPGAPLALSAAAGSGITSFMLPDGRYGIVRGGGTGIDIYDINFVTGTTKANTQDAYYESECVSNTNLTPDSTLNWTQNGEGKIAAYVRTATSPALCSQSTYIPIAQSGDRIAATTTADNSIQFKFVFQRELPRFIDQEWGIRKTGQTRYRRVNADPVLFDVTVDNGAVLHRSQFDFGNNIATASSSAAASGPVSINIVNDSNRSNALALASGISTTINGTNAAFYNGTFQSQPQLQVATASTTVVMKRSDGKFVIISGSATLNSQVYDETTSTTTLRTSAPQRPTQALGLGGFAFKRPDGKFLIVMGAGVVAATSTTNIYDPVADTFVAGPSLASPSGTNGAGMGASAIPLPNGRVLIMHGGGTSHSSIYDPVQNTMTVGPQPRLSATAIALVGSGSLWIPRPEGTYLFIPGRQSVYPACGASNTVTNNFDPYTMQFTFTGAPVMTASGTGAGAYAFQRKDGQWIIVQGLATATSCVGLTTTMIYNPFANTPATLLAGGPVITSTQGLGGQALPRPDGNWLIISGATVTSVGQVGTSIYTETGGAAAAGSLGNIGISVAGPSFSAAGVAPNSGSVSFQRSDGKFVIIAGAATTTVGNGVQLYDAGWVQSGIYKSEQFNLSPVGTKLDSNSTLVWKSNIGQTTLGSISAEVKTAASQGELATTSTRGLASNGDFINPDATDTWLQINFNFRRAFPSYGGIYTDTWNNNGGSAMNFPQRPILTPVLYEYKVTKDKDLINLQSDGLSVFRVSTGGDIFAQAGGTINASGADLAERYTSQEELQKGMVVAIDPQNNHGVKKTSYQYQPDILGVVSTDPGFVAGAYTENSYPIALIGRVPVKVTTENGMVRVGDYLTAASVPGYAMKATLSGRVIGKALESLDPEKLSECPASDIYIPGRKCGTIVVFVNLIDYTGQSVGLAMSDWKSAKASDLALLGAQVGLEVNPSVDGNSEIRSIGTATVPVIQTHQQDILMFLNDLKAERGKGVSAQSEIFTDKISAVSSVISPEFIANAVHTEALTTSTISGSTVGSLSLSIIGDKLVVHGVKASVLSLATSTELAITTSTPNASTTPENASTTEASVTSLDSSASAGTSIVISFDTTGNAYFAGEVVAQKVSTGALSVSGPATFAGGLEVTDLGTASTTMNIQSDSVFFGRPYFTRDTGGSALIKAGAQSVDIVFGRDYIEQPIVTASMSFNEASTTDADIEKLFSDDIRFIITKKNVRGFTIVLNSAASVDIAFNWIALAVKDSKEFTSRTVTPEAVPADIPISPIAVDTTSTTTPSTGTEMPSITPPADTATSTSPLLPLESATSSPALPPEPIADVPTEPLTVDDSTTIP